MTKRERIKIPYGKGLLQFVLPQARLLGILQNRKGPGKDLRRMLRSSLNRPSAASMLKESIGRKRRRVLIVVPDSTRSAHLKDILPVLLKRIKGAATSVDIIAATGLHKKHDRAQLKALVGNIMRGRVRIMSHDQEAGTLEKKGRTSKGIPIVLNKRLKSYDSILTIGVIEPHLYAGYSGGAKTIAIGLAGEDTINATHGIRFLDDPHTKIGSVKGNIFQDTLWEILGDIDVSFTIACVNDSDGKALAVFSGSIRDVFREGVNFSKRIFEVSAPDSADVVICGVGYPKDVNLYQASRAVNYVLNVERPVLRKGGVLIVAAELRDGIGDGLSEKRFYEALKTMVSPQDFINKTKRNGCIAGEHRAYMVARPMLDYNIAFVTKKSKQIGKGLPFPCFEEMNEALEYAGVIVGASSKIYIIPRALSTIAGKGTAARN